MKSITSLFVLSWIVASVSGLADKEYKACWDIELSDEDMFCYGAV